jgi:CheY-like chemotaxis protein
MSKRKILIVDDEQTIRWILKMALEVNNIKIFEATTGREGVEAAKDLAPDLIIMDYKMPDMNGWEATKKIREFMPDTPIIGHTGYANDKNVEDGFQCGCTEILKKPVDLSEWENTIKAYLED